MSGILFFIFFIFASCETLIEILDQTLTILEDWYDKGIIYIRDLLNPPHPGFKLFEGLAKLKFLILMFHIRGGESIIF